MKPMNVAPRASRKSPSATTLAGSQSPPRPLHHSRSSIRRRPPSPDQPLRQVPPRALPLRLPLLRSPRPAPRSPCCSFPRTLRFPLSRHRLLCPRRQSRGVEVQEEILEKTSQLCDEIIDICNEVEAAVVDAVAELPVWGSPRQLVSSLCSPDEQTAPLPAWGKRQPMDSLCSPVERTFPGTN